MAKTNSVLSEVYKNNELVSLIDYIGLSGVRHLGRFNRGDVCLYTGTNGVSGEVEIIDGYQRHDFEDGVMYGYTVKIIDEDTAVSGAREGFVAAHRLRMLDGRVRHIRLVSQFGQGQQS